MADIRKLLKEETIVICPKGVYKKLSKALKGHTIKKLSRGIK